LTFLDHIRVYVYIYIYIVCIYTYIHIYIRTYMIGIFLTNNQLVTEAAAFTIHNKYRAIQTRVPSTSTAINPRLRPQSYRNRP
jgi:hypothetical protein